MNDSNDPLDSLPWEEIQQISQQGLFEEVFKKLPKSLFKFAANDKNRSVLVASALKSLRKTDPSASQGQASVLADVMQTFAKKLIEEKK